MVLISILYMNRVLLHEETAIPTNLYFLKTDLQLADFWHLKAQSLTDVFFHAFSHISPILTPVCLEST